MTKKFTMIVIGNKRPIISFEISTVSIILILSVIIGVVSIPITFYVVNMYSWAPKPALSRTRTKVQNDNYKNIKNATNPRKDKEIISFSGLQSMLTIEDFDASSDNKKNFMYFPRVTVFSLRRISA
jgi:hypothetical protein